MAGDLSIPDAIIDYVRAVSPPEHPVLRRLHEETSRHPRGTMQISPEHGQFMAFLVQLIRAERTIEIGVFTGYSAMAVALALPEAGRVVACDISEEYTSVARRYWKDAGVEKKIDLRLKPALETLQAMIASGERGRYDFAFIDADKPNYWNYYECCLELLRRGGVIMVDNTLWSGRVADPSDQTEDTVALRGFNERLRDDSRVTVSMLTLDDGVTLALKR
ncbi:MAG: class I SAM-dependent methyltransferase [Bryobacterales bacterium]|nr:class I SAM-dependent methyltransferase [Bryobacterales bacterium]MBV9400754.1 class I SAM-dependent methyltransferase [Bryobacterales bacterium]